MYKRPASPRSRSTANTSARNSASAWRRICSAILIACYRRRQQLSPGTSVRRNSLTCLPQMPTSESGGRYCAALTATSRLTMPKEGPVPKSYPVLLVALMSAGGWYFTKGPGRQIGRCRDRRFKGQYDQIGQIIAGPSPPAAGYGNYPQTRHIRITLPIQSQPVATQTPPQATAATAPQPVSAPPAPPPPTPMSGGPAIRIATFNIQVFGEAKARSRTSCRRWRRSSKTFNRRHPGNSHQDDYFIDNFLRTYVNTNGHVYDKVIGPRLGRTVSKEQYAFLYDTAAIEVNPQQHLHRERPGRPAAPRAARRDVPRPRPAARSKRLHSS